MKEKDLISELEEMRRTFHDFFVSKNPMMSMGDTCWRPPMDVFDTSEGTMIRLEIAGMEIEDIAIVMEGDRLIIQGTRTNQRDSGPAPRCYRQMEIKYASFQREVLVTHAVKEDRIEASYRNGFLEVRIPSEKEVSQAKKINIKIEKGS